VINLYRIILAYAKAAGIESLSPHGLRASFVTLALEGGAKAHLLITHLSQVTANLASCKQILQN
jgi:integrase